MKKMSLNGSHILIIVVAVAAFFLILDYHNRANARYQIEQQLAIIETDVAELRITEQFLMDEIEFAESVGGVDQYAREDNHMSQPGDVVVVPVPQDGYFPTPTPVIVPTQKALDNFTIWKAVIFGIDPFAD